MININAWKEMGLGALGSAVTVHFLMSVKTFLEWLTAISDSVTDIQKTIF